MNEKTKAIADTSPRSSALAALAQRMGVEPDALFLSSLRSVAFKAPNASNEQLLALCVVANQYGLNPFLRELYAFPDKGGGIVPIVSVDGWARILNDSDQFDGMTFEQADDWCECTIYRKDRAHPIRAREYLAECKRDTAPWKSHPRRMLRHKSMIQAARMAFGFAGIYDPDEAERIIEGGAVDVVAPATSQVERIKSVLGVAPLRAIDEETGEVIGELLPIGDANATPPPDDAA